jgi:hypothetical protein
MATRVVRLSLVCVLVAVAFASSLRIPPISRADGPRTPVVLVLQQGLDDYAGTTDAYIDRWLPERSWPGGDWLMITASEDRAALLRFDLSDQVPEGSTVHSATLEVYATGRTKILNQRVAAYTLLRPWSETEVTWRRSSVGQPWATPGCNAAEEDREGTPIDAIQVTATQQWYRFNLTRLVQRWANDPATNQGVLLKGVYEGQPAEYMFLTSESGQTALRPILRIEYTPGTMPVDAGAALVRFDPTAKSVSSTNAPVTVDVYVEGVSSLGGFQFVVGFDPSVVRAQQATLSSWVTAGTRSFSVLGPQLDNAAGRITFGAFSYGAEPAPGGPGTMATLTFMPVAHGTSVLRLEHVQIADPEGAPYGISVRDGSIVVLAGLIGDVDGDCDIDVTDIMAIANHWGSRRGDAAFEARFDLDADDDIDVNDIMLVASHWGESCGS